MSASLPRASLRGADPVLLAQGEAGPGQALAVALALLRLDLGQHRAEALVGHDGPLRDVRVLVVEDAAGKQLAGVEDLDAAVLGGAAEPLGARHPQARVGHPSAERLARDPDAVLLRELLTRESRSEVGVASSDEVQRVLANRLGQLPVAGTTALAGDETAGSVASQRPTQALDLAQAQPQLLCGPPLGQPSLDHATQHLEPIQLHRAHRPGSCTVHVGLPAQDGAENPTFLSC